MFSNINPDLALLVAFGGLIGGLIAYLLYTMRERARTIDAVLPAHRETDFVQLPISDTPEHLRVGHQYKVGLGMYEYVEVPVVDRGDPEDNYDRAIALFERKHPEKDIITAASSKRGIHVVYRFYVRKVS